jgi:predicted outer membrane protein
MTRTTRLLLFAGAVAALAGACKGANEQRAPDTPTAREVDSTEALAYLAAVNQAEVEAAQRGARRANTTEVRRFAQLMWREHAQAGRDVAELARQMELDLRNAAPQSSLVANVRSMGQQTTQQLDRIPRSPEFDRAYVESQVRAHQAVLQDLRRILGDSSRRVSASLAPGGGVDVGVTGRPDTADAAAAARRSANRKAENAQEAVRMTLTRVQQHLDSARKIQAWLGGARSSPPAPSSARAPRRRAGARP